MPVLAALKSTILDIDNSVHKLETPIERTSRCFYYPVPPRLRLASDTPTLWPSYTASILNSFVYRRLGTPTFL
jgi:hypothetical protein